MDSEIERREAIDRQHQQQVLHMNYIGIWTFGDAIAAKSVIRIYSCNRMA